jgi:hypothetical protein
MDQLTQGVLDALRDLKHTYLGKSTTIDRSCRFRTLEKEQMRHFEDCLGQIKASLNLMEDWVNEIEKELIEQAPS